MMRIRMALLVPAFVALGAVSAIAQTATAQDVPSAVEDVFVRSTDGIEIRGGLIDFGPASLSLFVDGARRDIPLDSVERIQRHSVWNGALIGAGIAAVLSSVAVATAGSEAIPFAIGATVGYALVGAGVDALIPGRTTIYSTPRSAGSTVGGKRAGLAFRIGF